MINQRGHGRPFPSSSIPADFQNKPGFLFVNKRNGRDVVGNIEIDGFDGGLHLDELHHAAFALVARRRIGGVNHAEVFVREDGILLGRRGREVLAVFLQGRQDALKITFKIGVADRPLVQRSIQVETEGGVN